MFILASYVPAETQSHENVPINTSTYGCSDDPDQFAHPRSYKAAGRLHININRLIHHENMPI